MKAKFPPARILSLTMIPGYVGTGGVSNEGDIWEVRGDGCKASRAYLYLLVGPRNPLMIPPYPEIRGRGRSVPSIIQNTLPLASRPQARAKS